MKLMIVVISVAVCCVVIPINGQTTRENPDANKNKTTNTQPPKNPDFPPYMAVINELGETQQTAATGKQDNDGGKAQAYLRGLFAPETLPNTILCLVGVFGVVAGFCTLKVIRAQTNEMKRGVLLQEVAMKQWVDTEKWAVKYRDGQGGYGVLDITFNIVNPTSWPLTVLDTKVTMPGVKEFCALHNIMLTPKTPYSVKLSEVDLDEKQKVRYLSEGLDSVVYGYILYRDCFGKDCEQLFSGRLHYSENNVSFVAELLINSPYEVWKHGGENKPKQK